MTRGKFITFEGGEGAGKSTQVALLGKAFEQVGRDVLVTREPGGSPGAEAVRELLVHGAVERWDATGEALLHFAARRAHLVETVWPALRHGTWVVCDRFTDSTMAYQGYGHELGRGPVEMLSELTLGEFTPDLTLILDIDAEAGLARAGGRAAGGTRYEAMGLTFHQRVRDGFLDIARREPGRCVVIDAGLAPEAVHDAVRAAATHHLGIDLP